jgi:hypothetical protein
MRKIFQAIFALVLLLTVSLFAQNMCIELCTPCQNKKDQTCKKVDKRCHCAALLDSISAAQASKDAAFAESINKLSDELLQTCDETVCARNISFENGLFKEIKQGPSPVSNETKQNLYETKFNNTQPEMSRIEPLPPMTEECSGFCGDCPVTDKMLKAKQPKFKDKFCKKIEQSCKCIDYAINKKQLEEQTKADSVAEFERKLQRIENAAVLAKQIQEHSINDSACTLTVVFANSEMAALDIQRAKEIIEKKQEATEETSTLVAAAEKPVEEKGIEETSVSNLQDTINTSAQSNNFGANFHEVNSSNSGNDSKKTKSNYLGLILAYESPESYDYYGRSLREYYSGFGLNAGFIFRHYFNRFISFNFGINAIYHNGEYGISVGSYYYNYHLTSFEFNTIMAEIPLGLRFGIPLGSSPISLFISTNFHIRKPIYQWLEYDLYVIDWYNDSYHDVAAYSDWEFIHLFGLGVELTRHFSLEIQWYAGNFRVYKDGYYSSVEEGYRNGDSWRIKLETTF